MTIQSFIQLVWRQFERFRVTRLQCFCCCTYLYGEPRGAKVVFFCLSKKRLCSGTKLEHTISVPFTLQH